MARTGACGLLIAAALLAAVPAGAVQVHIKYLDKNGPPQNLPGDNLPPFGVLDANGKLNLGPPPTPGRPPLGAPHKPESTVAGPKLEVAMAGALAAIAECRRTGAYGAVAVVDTAGDARAMLSADGSDGSHVFVAQRKALVALEFEMPSAKVKDLARAGDPAILARIQPNMFVQFGGYPITSKGKVIGAIGYSGGDDEACAMAGLDVIQKRLPQ